MQIQLLSNNMTMPDASQNMGGKWDIGSFLTNSATQLRTWGNILIVLIGVALIIWSAVQIARGLMTKNSQQVSWPKNIIMLIVGGAFVAGGFALMSTLASGGKDTIVGLGGGTTGGTMMIQGILSMLGL